MEVHRDAALQPFLDIEICGKAHVEALLPGVDDDSIVVEITEGPVHLDRLRTAVHREIVLLAEARLGHHILPVDIVQLIVILSHPGGEAALAVGLDGLAVGDEPVLEIGYFKFACIGGDTVVCTEIDPGLAGLAFAGRHHDDAVGAAGTVDGRSRSVLQDLDVLDVHRVEPGEVGTRAVLDAVNHPQGVGVAVHRGDAADADVRATGRVTAGLRDHHARRCALETLGDVDRGATVHSLGIDRSHRAGDVALLLRTVAYHHGLFDKFGILLHENREPRLVAYGDLLVLVADGGDDDNRSGTDGEREGSVGTGHGAVRG